MSILANNFNFGILELFVCIDEQVPRKIVGIFWVRYRTYPLLQKWYFFSPLFVLIALFWFNLKSLYNGSTLILKEKWSQIEDHAFWQIACLENKRTQHTSLNPQNKEETHKLTWELSSSVWISFSPSSWDIIALYHHIVGQWILNSIGFIKKQEKFTVI